MPSWEDGGGHAGCGEGERFASRTLSRVTFIHIHKGLDSPAVISPVFLWACEGPGAPWWPIPVRHWQRLLKHLPPHFSHAISEREDRVASYLLVSPETGQSEMRSSGARRHFRGHYLLAIRLITMMAITLASADHGFQVPARLYPE